MVKDNNISANKPETEAVRFARAQVSSGMWNVNLMMGFFIVLVLILILEFAGLPVQAVAAVAFVGLLVIWILARIRYKKLYKQILTEEQRRVQESATEAIPAAASPADEVEPAINGGASLIQSPLTSRQREILSFIAAGYPNKQIAAQLNLTEQTIKNQVRTIYLKLGVRDRTQAVLLAMRQGWITSTTSQAIPPEEVSEEESKSD